MDKLKSPVYRGILKYNSNVMKKGFTLVELLVVVAIIGLMAGIATVSVNSVRSKGRDAKRVADIKQIQNALELHYSDVGDYPDAPANNSTLGTTTAGANNAQVLSSSGWEAALTAGATAYMTGVPRDPMNSGLYTYTYTVDADTTKDYTITFRLESGAGSFGSGNFSASSAGIQSR